MRNITNPIRKKLEPLFGGPDGGNKPLSGYGCAGRRAGWASGSSAHYCRRWTFVVSGHLFRLKKAKAKKSLMASTANIRNIGMSPNQRVRLTRGGEQGGGATPEGSGKAVIQEQVRAWMCPHCGFWSPRLSGFASHLAIPALRAPLLAALTPRLELFTQ
jgi:hypothetical protein